MFRVLVALILMGPALLAGCERDRGDGERSGADAAATQSAGDQATYSHREQDQADLDQLRSLPYVGFSPVAEDEQQDGTVVHDRERSYPGYNLYTIRELCKAVVFDAEGRVINTWQDPGGRFWERTELLSNGDCLIVGSSNLGLPRPRISDESRYLMRLDWTGKVIWKRSLLVHHDVQVTPQGRILVLGFKRRLIPEVHPDIQTREDHLIMLDQAGKVLEMRSLYDAFRARPDIFRFQRVGPNTLGGVPWVDLFHSNSLEWMYHEHLFGRDPIYASDNVLVCSRHQDIVVILNWPRNEIVWAWGQGQISGPHDAQVLESGNILIFDNGVGRNCSRVIELDPLSREIVWEYKAPEPSDFYTRGRGSAQRLPNGNTLITESKAGRAFEVTRRGEIVWEFRCPERNQKGERASLVRTIRYETSLIKRILEAHR
jgi:hypothetical protein